MPRFFLFQNRIDRAEPIGLETEAQAPFSKNLVDLPLLRDFNPRRGEEVITRMVVMQLSLYSPLQYGLQAGKKIQQQAAFH